MNRVPLPWVFYHPLVLLLAALVGGAIAHRLAPPDRRPPLPVTLIRWLLGVVFALSGLSKLEPAVPNVIGPIQLESLLAPHGLALLARFVAVSEAAVGLLLLWRRTATLGAVMLVPLLTGILLVTTSLHWRGTPVVVAVLLGLNAVLLVYDLPKLLPILQERPPPNGWRLRVSAPSPARQTNDAPRHD